ncbi:MAG: ribose-phosphate diphosphokinase [Candidatus Paceibacterota bacterium]
MKNFVVGDNLGKNLANHLNWKFIKIEERIFPDGEIQPRLSKEEKGDKTILILQKKTKENINAYLFKYFLLARKLKNLFSTVIGIMPYFPYARQDDEFRKGEILSSLYLAEILEKNLDIFLTISLHEHRKKIKELFKIPAYNLSFFSELAKEFKNFEPKTTVVIGPDSEAKNFVNDFCKNFPAEKIILNKKRNVNSGKLNFSFNAAKLINFKGKEAIIVDDMTSTGDTLLEVAEIIKKMGVKSISFAFIHSILGDDSVKKLKKINPKKIVLTNTLENSFFSVDITKPLTEYLKNIKII